jgi:hypothetical protein
MSSESLKDVGTCLTELGVTMQEWLRALEALNALLSLDFAPDECSPDTSQEYPFEVRMIS